MSIENLNKAIVKAGYNTRNQPVLTRVMEQLALNPSDSAMEQIAWTIIRPGLIEAELRANPWIETAPVASDFAPIDESNLILGKLVDRKDCFWTYKYNKKQLPHRLFVGGSRSGKSNQAVFHATQIIQVPNTVPVLHGCRAPALLSPTVPVRVLWIDRKETGRRLVPLSPSVYSLDDKSLRYNIWQGVEGVD